MISSLVDIAPSDNTLRPYQIDSKKEIYEAWLSMKSILFQMPTGTGKTRLFASIINDIRTISVRKKIVPQPRILILAHRTELINQIYDTLLHKYHIVCGVIKSGIKETPEALVQIASVQSLSRRLSRWEKVPFGFIVIDEAHHALAKTYSKICRTFVGAKILGVTATPCRLNKESFRKLFDKLITSPSVQHFIDAGYLSPIEYYSIRPDNYLQYELDSINVFGANGDYAEKELMGVCDKAKIRAQLVKSYQEYANGKKGIVYTINQTHNKHIAEQYLEIGVRVATIDSNTPDSERKRIVREFKNNTIDVICNVNIFSEGFDCPDIDFIQLARPTLSLSLYLQQVGRALRKSEGKERALILDNVGSYNKFGLPNIERNWERYFNGFGHQESEKLKRRAKLNKEEKKEVEEADDEMLLIETMGESVNLLNEYEKYNIYDILTTFQQFPIGVIKYLHDSEYSHMQSRGEFDHLHIIAGLNEMPCADKFNSLDDYIEYVELEIFSHETYYEDNEVAHMLCNNTFLFQANGKFGICRLRPQYDILRLCEDFTQNPRLVPISEYFEELLEPVYDKIEVPNTNDEFVAVKGGRYGVINGNDWTEVIPLMYEDIYVVSNFFTEYIVRKGGKEGVLSHSGSVIVPVEYNSIYPSRILNAYVCELGGEYALMYKEKLIYSLDKKVRQLTDDLSVFCLESDNKAQYITTNAGCILYPYGANEIYLTQNVDEICLEFNNKHILLDFNLKEKTDLIDGLHPNRSEILSSARKKKKKAKIADNEQKSIEKKTKIDTVESSNTTVKVECSKQDVVISKPKRPRIRRVIDAKRVI